jgi:hypothetical protein
MSALIASRVISCRTTRRAHCRAAPNACFRIDHESAALWYCDCCRLNRQRDASRFYCVILTILIECLIIVFLLIRLAGGFSRQGSIEHKRTVAYPDVLSLVIKAQ